jgi:hypothetical protein
VADTADEAAATGGAPVVEQALAALRLDVAVRPIPALPDRAEDLAPFAGVMIDDPPGLTPEQRHALQAFVEQGGVVLLALGPRAAAAPLGASLEPIVVRAITWSASPVPGVDPESAAPALADAALSTEDLAPKGRITLGVEDASAFETLLAWKDKAPLVGRRTFGRGEAWVVTLPFAVDASDFTLRPAFLVLLDAWVAEARLRAAPRRTDVGVPWTFPAAREVKIDGPSGPLLVTRDQGLARAIPSLAGAYRIALDGKKELRVASPVAREVDLRPRPFVQPSDGATLGDRRASADISWAIALALLALLTLEIGLRVYARTRVETA